MIGPPNASLYRSLLSGVFIVVFGAVASAQFGNEWVECLVDNSRISATSQLVLNDHMEKDYAWGDLDQDGWTDLVIVRKQPFASAGRAPNVLLMNENGILTDRTAQFAANSDVVGDEGFLTPTNDRDVVVVDLNMDGWLDVVTATTLGSGDPKHISHPRVYMNLGESLGGSWLGLRHEDARFPQLLLQNGQPSWPRFSAVAAGDLNGDGFADLYFVDSDVGGVGGGDMNDRLLVNDGSGYFADESSRMTSLMLNSDAGTSVSLIDMNRDSAIDVVKATGESSPVRIIYNNPDNVGSFSLTDMLSSGAETSISVGDLNLDGRPDIVVSSEAQDGVFYNLGNDSLGRAEFGPIQLFDILSGGDDGVGGNSLIVDLDSDGWKDVIVTDVSDDVSGCHRRTHVYRNPGATGPGVQIELVEEAQQAGSSGWKGIVGLSVADLRGTHDVAVFDIDNNGSLDAILGRCQGTEAYVNIDPGDSDCVKAADKALILCTQGCGEDEFGECEHHCFKVYWLVLDQKCGNTLGSSHCASNPNSTGQPAIIAAFGSVSVSEWNLTLNSFDLPSNQPGVFFFGLNQVMNPFGNGFLCVSGSTVRISPPAFSNGSGEANRAVDFNVYGGQLASGSTWNFQFWYRDPAGGGAGFNLTNGLEITFTP